MKRIIYIIFTLLLLNVGLFAKGQTEESDYKEVAGKENWEYEVPIEEMEPGQYNLLIRAKDKANNETFSGPFDIFIDPLSDLPIVSITNPSSFMRVGGVLNIVGTARDDDGIKTVLLSIDDGEFFEAEGSEFWSYTLEDDIFTDGQHTLRSKAIDINGLEGLETVVIYNQDTIKPVNSVDNYSNGAIFAGKVSIKGRVIDANGIKRMDLSTDNQESFQPVKLKKADDEDFYTFELDIDTKKLEDGPNIYWFKSEDGTGSVGFSAFLFFVDNIGPEIIIVDPKEDEALNGLVTISGKISDSIGVKSLKYQYGEEIGDILLSPGNPYWSQSINTLATKGNKLKVEFFAEDLSGNIGNNEYLINIDREKDKPILHLNSPVAGEVYDTNLILDGYISDDDLVDGLVVYIDGEERDFIKTFNSFSKIIPDLTSGSHKLKILAKDSDGVLGDPMEISFDIKQFAPKILVNSVDKNNSEFPYYPGLEIPNDMGYKILGSVSYGNQLTELYYKIGKGEFVELKKTKGVNDSTALFSIKVDSLFNYGAVNYTIKAVDIYGNETLYNSYIYITNYTINNSPWGLYTVPFRDSDVIPLKTDNPFKIYFNGPSIDSVEIEPKTDNVKIGFKKDIITISPGEDGISGPIRVVINSSKGIYKSNKLRFTVDKDNPVIELKSPKVDSTESKAVIVSGSVEELSIDTLEYRFSNQETFTKLGRIGSGDLYTFKQTIAIPETTQESLALEIVAVDKLGNRSSVRRSFKIKENTFVQTLTKEEIDANTSKTSDKPVLIINFPKGTQTYFSEPTLSGFTRDDDGVKELKISEAVEGGKSRTYKTTGLFDISLENFGQGSHTLNIVSVDINGVESKIKKITYKYIQEDSSISIDNIIEPTGTTKYNIGALVSSETGVSVGGSVNGFSSGTLFYNFGEDEAVKASLEDGKFNIPVPKTLKWGRNDLKLLFTDIYGRETLTKTFFYIVDKVNTTNISDDEGIYVNDNRIDNDYIDISNGNVFTLMYKGRDIKDIKLEAESGDLDPFISVSNSGNKIIIKAISQGISGRNRVVVESVDGDIYKSEFYKYINDTLPPVLTIKTKNNIFIKNNIVLAGEFYDGILPSKLYYSINQGATWLDINLAEPKKAVKKEAYTETLKVEESAKPKEIIRRYTFSEEIDYTTLPDGGYTLYIKGDDKSGNEIVKSISFVKDNTNPKISLHLPGIDEVNGVISIIGKSSDNIELSSISYSKNGVDFTPIDKGNVFKFSLDFGEDEIFPKTFTVRAKDMADNYSDIFPIFNINSEKDKPVVQIQTPIDGEIIRNDFIISGMAFDDDSVSSILYSLDGEDFRVIEKNKSNFSLNIPLSSIENNSHTIRVKAIDLLGVESDIKESTFKVSKEEPSSILLLPKIDETKRSIVKLSGTSSDKNGIDSVYVSTDNGVSYQKANGTEEWNFNFNTKNIKDGTYSIFIKAIDKLQTPGFYSTLINIDNTPPELIITEPFDGDILSDKIVFSGRSMDNIGLKEVKYKIYNHSDDNKENIVVGQGALSSGGIFNVEIPLDGYDVGDYNIELIAYDNADNRSISTRNFSVTASDDAGDLELLFPQGGSSQTSIFEVSGKVVGRKKVESVECFIDDKLFSQIKVNEFNYYNLAIDTLRLSNGEHKVQVTANLPDGQVYNSEVIMFSVKNTGPWLNIINMKTGDNISNRPFLTGEAGYIQDIPLDDPEFVRPSKVEVSLDNGQRFQPAVGSVNWSFRIETWQYDDGLTPILVRAYYSNGETQTAKIAVNIDRSKPDVNVLEDLEQGRFNQAISISGTAFDSNGLTDISVVLRDGNKSSYQIPGLFQGMFVDVTTSYGKTIEAGIGLTFFDDNVKLQFIAGDTRILSEEARIKGMFYGGKLLANLYTLEFGSFLGPDWNFFSMSLGLGASFTQKTLTISDIDYSMWYSAIVIQYEFAKFKLNNEYFSSVSLFSELEATLISSENSGGFYPRIGIGSRFGLF